MRFKVLLLLLIATLLGWKAFGQLRDLGNLTVKNGLTWDHDDTNVIHFNVYVSDASLTNYAKVATVSTNVWPGDATKDFNGKRGVYVTALNEAALESEPSEKVLVNFRAGIPYPPTRIQIYSVITAAATNALPPAPPLPK